MNSQVVKTNQAYIEKKIREALAVFCDEIISKNKEINDLRERLQKTDERRCELARAYAKKIGTLVTKKQFEKRTGED